MQNLFSTVGRRSFDILYYIGGLTKLVMRSFSLAVTPPLKYGRVIDQIKKTGVESLGIVSLVALFMGIIMALQTAYQMQRFGSEMYIASIVALSLVRELGPVLTALVVAGRVGAAIAAEIGSMQVTEQVDALETFAADPVKYLVVPRFLALCIALPLLTIYADIIGIFGGYFICINKLAISSTMYLRITFDFLFMKDLFTGLVKTVVFGMIIAFVSCFEGFKVKGGAEGVGRATMRAVVVSFILIIIADCFFTTLFYFVMH